MLYRKVEKVITEYFMSDSDKVLVVTGARQIGKSYIIRYCAKKIFKNIVEINLIEDADGNRIFDNVKTTDDFYLALSAFTSKKLGSARDTIIFLDEIQQYPNLLTLLKFLREDGRYRYVASGSLLGVSLKKSASIPLGSIDIVKMYPLDFEEFLLANDFGEDAISALRKCFENIESVPAGIHDKVMSLYKRYLLVGGLPEAVNAYLETRDLNRVRSVQQTISELYRIDAAKYDQEHALKIARIYSLIPSNMENKKKRVVYKDIEGVKGRRASDYEEEVEYLVSSGIALEVNAISNPRFPLGESEQKNLLKLYFNDPGLLTAALYRNNPTPILNNETGINLGSVYECAVACQLAANDNKLFYYDNRTHGEVDFLYDDFDTLSVVPIEVKSGKDYKRHVAISRFVANKEYGIKRGYVLSNSGNIEQDGNICYIPVYFALFFDNRLNKRGPILI
ncbi:MAG: AAA family ATPase [Muribaculaceae bacterium]|nr:AAA family ATPase [Muribaculaceae bacterium]